MSEDPVTILLVDDQPAKLLSYEVVLQELPGLNIIKATSARDANRATEGLMRTGTTGVEAHARGG